ncbi:MAG: fimbrillin family protein [Bacteroidales bacterium]|nr:fimbrillin family protein [Bacteroidales bacterium]
MRKYFAFALLALAVLFSGCQRENESDMANLNSRRSSNIGILAKIVAADTRTTLDGLTIKWAAGDRIGVFNASAKNVPLTLASDSAGSTEGLFTGTFSAGTPRFAYYPYKEGATCTSTTVNLTLPAEQTQSGNAPDMSYDVKVGDYVSGSASENYTFTFKEKLALLQFTLTPGSDLAGDVLESISFTDEGRALAGDYTLNMDKAEAALSFGSSASAVVTLGFSATPTLSASETVTGWMFVNPSVASGDDLVIKVRTDKHIVNVTVKASKDYQAGYRYTMPLNVPALVAAGKATISSSAPAYDITGLTDAGVIDLMSKEYTCKYEAGVNQYAIFSNTVSGETRRFCRIQSLPGGYAVEMSAPVSPVAGSEVSVQVTAYGNTPIVSGTFNATVVKVNDDMMWLSDAENQTGYILIRR